MSAYLGIDIGTSSIKLCILDGSSIIEQRTVPVEDLSIHEGSIHMRDISEIWRRLADALRKMQNTGKVVALSVDGTSGSIVPVNENMEPRYLELMYNDARAVEEATILSSCKEAKKYEAYLPISSTLVIPKVMWLKRNLNRKWKFILHESDYIVYKLCNEIATSSNTAGKSHANIYGEGYWSEVYLSVGLDPSIMPKIYPVGAEVGEVTSPASQKTGIPFGAKVYNGVTDSTASDISTGVFKPGSTNITLGTTIVVHTACRKPKVSKIGSYYLKSYVENLFLAAASTNAGAKVLNTIKQLAKLSHQELSHLAEDIPPGSEGIVVQPQWSGSRSPKPNPKLCGCLIGLREETFDFPHLYRALIEGNSYLIRQILEDIESSTGEEITELYCTGGLASNILQLKIISHVTGKAVRRVDADASLGSALIALSSYLGRKLSEVAPPYVKTIETHHPDPSIREVYNKYYERFLTLSDMCHEIYR